jgi:hypothetical protein
LIFYPHYAFSTKDNGKGKYCGGSCCSAKHCGVHKITPEYACKLMALGFERLEKLWDKAIKSDNTDKKWSEYVEELYAKEFPKGFE